MAKTLRVRTKDGWVTKPEANEPENALVSEEIDDNFLALEDQIDGLFDDGLRLPNEKSLTLGDGSTYFYGYGDGLTISAGWKTEIFSNGNNDGWGDLLLSANGSSIVLTPSSGITISGDTTIDGQLTETSSIRYKENVAQIEDALELITQLQGVTYDRKDGCQQNEPGLIAEEVEKVIPNLVERNEEGEVESLRYSKITAYLIEAVKELKEEVDRLKNG